MALQISEMEVQSFRTLVASSPGFTFPTGPAKPEESGSGIPARFGRLPVGTGQIQIWIQTSQFNRLDRYTGRFGW